jgi:hypothetical protein
MTRSGLQARSEAVIIRTGQRRACAKTRSFRCSGANVSWQRQGASHGALSWGRYDRSAVDRMTAEELRQKAVNDAIVCCPLLPPNNTGRRADIDLQTCVEPICRSRTLRRRNFSAASGSRTGLLDPDQAKNPERAEVCRCVVVWHDKFRAMSW